MKKSSKAKATVEPVKVKRVRTSGSRKAPDSQPTLITAKIDVGFGNHLYIRGDGPGLSWERGTPMDCLGNDQWSFSISSSAKPVVFKFCLNDTAWCAGDDFVIEPGKQAVYEPTF